MSNNPSGPRYAIGVDVGGTKVAAGIVQFATARVLHHIRRPSNGADRSPTTIETVSAVVQELLAIARIEDLLVEGIGLGVPELVTLDGEIASGQSFVWSTDEVSAALQTGHPLVNVSDVQAAATAEALYGAGVGAPVMLYVSIGTGISHTLTIDGRPFRGGRGHALLFACSAIPYVCGICSAEETRVLETRASGPAIATSFGGGATTADVLAAAESNDARAYELLEKAGTELGVAVGHLVNVLDPLRIVVGGGLGSDVTGIYWTAFVETVRRMGWNEELRRTPVVKAKLGAAAGVIGAANAVLSVAATTSNRTGQGTVGRFTMQAGV